MDFFQTIMGRTFYESTMPTMVKQLTRIANALEAGAAAATSVHTAQPSAPAPATPPVPMTVSDLTEALKHLTLDEVLVLVTAIESRTDIAGIKVMTVQEVAQHLDAKLDASFAERLKASWVARTFCELTDADWEHWSDFAGNGKYCDLCGALLADDGTCPRLREALQHTEA